MLNTASAQSQCSLATHNLVQRIGVHLYTHISYNDTCVLILSLKKQFLKKVNRFEVQKNYTRSGMEIAFME